MSDLHVLVDFENVQPTFDQVAKLAPGASEVWLFYGPHQVKLVEQFRTGHEGVTPVPISRTGRNALDFHLSFYLGYVAAKNPKGRLVVIANDKGYDPMIIHAKALGFTTQRVGFKAKAAPVAKQVPAAKTVAAAKARLPGKTKSAAKKAVSGKKTVDKKAPAVKAKPGYNGALGKKAVAAHSPPVFEALTQPPEASQILRMTNGFARMGDKRPEKRTSVMRHVGSMLGQQSTAAAIQQAVNQLEKAGVFKIAGEKVVFK